MYNAWFRRSFYSRECFKNYDISTMNFNDLDKIWWKNLLTKFAWVIRRRSSQSTFIMKTCNAIQKPSFLGYFWTSIFIKIAFLMEKNFQQLFLKKLPQIVLVPNVMKNESTDRGTSTSHDGLDETLVVAETVLHVAVESNFQWFKDWNRNFSVEERLLRMEDQVMGLTLILG